MAEFIEVMKQKKRMCDSNKTSCSTCDLNEQARVEGCGPCDAYEMRHPQQAEEIIMKWAEEHPVKTNADKFKEVFGFEPNHNSCPYTIEKCDGKGCSRDCDKYDFWKQEYKEPKVKEE